MARAWLRGTPKIDATLIGRLQHLGAPTHVIEAAQADIERQRQAAVVRVWPEHWHAAMLLLAMHTQWHMVTGPRGDARLGLRYEAIKAVLPVVRAQVPAAHRQPYPVLMRQLQDLEAGVLDAQAEG